MSQIWQEVAGIVCNITEGTLATDNAKHVTCARTAGEMVGSFDFTLDDVANTDIEMAWIGVEPRGVTGFEIAVAHVSDTVKRIRFSTGDPVALADPTGFAVTFKRMTGVGV
jgi:hypothetical protein